MLEKHILYPEAEKRLQSSGLMQRVDEFLKRDDSDLYGYLGFICDDDMKSMFEEMSEEGYLKKLPEELKQIYAERINSFYQDKNNFVWVVKKPKEERQEVKPEEFTILSGYWASQILTPEEFWDYQRFGFDSFSELHGSIGVLLQCKRDESNSFMGEGYIWETEKDSQRFTSEISGDSNGDFKFFRTELTPYETLDPFGNKVYYRPALKSDIQGIYSYHSVETWILMAMLKYIEQEGLESEILKNKAKKFLEDFKRGSHHLGPFADAGYDFMGPKKYFPTFDLDKIPRIEEPEIGFLMLPTTASGIYYTFYTDKDQNLLVSYEKEGEKPEERKDVLRIFPSEVDHIIRGLFTQAQRGLGRTSSKQLVDILEYYFSEQFKQDMKELQRK